MPPRILCPLLLALLVTPAAHVFQRFQPVATPLDIGLLACLGTGCASRSRDERGKVALRRMLGPLRLRHGCPQLASFGVEGFAHRGFGDLQDAVAAAAEGA